MAEDMTDETSNMNEDMGTPDDCNAVSRAKALLTSLGNLPDTSDIGLVIYPEEPTKADGTKGIPAPNYKQPDINFEAITNVGVEGFDISDLTKATGAADRAIILLDKHLDTQTLSRDQKAKIIADNFAPLFNISTQYVLSKDLANWDAVAAQYRAREAEVNAATAQLNFISSKDLAKTNRTNLATARIGLATAEKNFLISCEKLTQEQKQTEILNAQTNDCLVQAIKVPDLDTNGVQKTDSSGELVFKTECLVKGSLGAQKALILQQKKAFVLESYLKFARLYTDAYAIDKANGAITNRPSGLKDGPVEDLNDEGANTFTVMTQLKSFIDTLVKDIQVEDPSFTLPPMRAITDYPGNANPADG